MNVQLEDNIYVTVALIVLMSTECSSRGALYKDYYDYDDYEDCSIRADIRRALYFDGDSRDLEKFITHTFNLRNPNPSYVFLLDDKKQRRVVMRRRDFKKPTFPNVTDAYITLSRMERRNVLEQGKNDRSSSFEPFPATFELGQEIEESNFVLENVRTERTFIEYMKNINKKGQELSLSFRKTEKQQSRIYKNNDAIVLKTNYNFDRKQRNRPVPTQDNSSDWEVLGLLGWTGQLSRPDYQNKLQDEDIRKRISTDKPTLFQRTSKKIKRGEAIIPLQFNFLDDPHNTQQWDLPGKVSNDYIPIIDENSESYWNISKMFNTTISPRWPIANTRAAHKNKDVFIARANNPFGYSTKWNFRNTSDESVSVLRQKRGVPELYSMLKCATGCDPLIFKGYGCYCGFLGSGKPTDGIDRCCQEHDNCYERSNCPSYLEYFVPYLWKCFNGHPLCAVDNGEWGSCATQLCKCDLSLSTCIRKYKCPHRRAVCRSNQLRMLQNFLMII